MRPPRNPLPLPVESPVPNEKRRHGRLRAEYLTCRLGPVLDISASGLRVLVKGRMRMQIGQELELDLRTVDRAVPVKVRVKRLRQLGWRRHEVGLEFYDVTAPIAKAISDVARYVAASADYSYPR